MNPGERQLSAEEPMYGPAGHPYTRIGPLFEDLKPACVLPDLIN